MAELNEVAEEKETKTYMSPEEEREFREEWNRVTGLLKLHKGKGVRDYGD